MKNEIQKSIRVLTIISLAISALVGAGCASIVHGGARSITVNSQPSGAKVAISRADTGEVVHGGTTPMTVSLSPKRGYFKGQSYDLKMDMPGYQSTTVTIRSELSGWYFGNIIFGGLIGMLAVDPVTGAMWNLSPEKIDQSLGADHASLLKNQSGFMVVLVQDLTETERQKMVRIN